MNDYLRIVEKLNKLKELDSRYKIFAAKRHQYRLNPCLTEESIIKFETKHKITLPNDYREFLLRVGNGGAGPSYGILPLEKFYYIGEWAQRMCKIHFGGSFDLSEVDPDFLAKPFPHTHDWENKHSEENEEDARENYISSFNYDIQGTIALCDNGCGHHCVLVVSGAEKGKVWYEFRSEGHGMGRVSNCFISWYEEWLDRSIRELEGFRSQRDILTCTVIEITGQGYARNVLIKPTNCNQTLNFYYIEHDEFIEPGRTSKIIKKNDSLVLSFCVESIEECKVMKGQCKPLFEQGGKEPSFFYANGEIKRVFDKGTFSCYISAIDKEVFIKPMVGTTVSIGDMIEIKGKLQADIFKVERNSNNYTQVYSINGDTKKSGFLVSLKGLFKKGR